MRPDHAVCASTVYLIRSLGTVYGVAVTSAIVQTTLSVRLPGALGDIPDKEAVGYSFLSQRLRNDGKWGAYSLRADHR